MTIKEYADRLGELYREGMKALQEDRIADKHNLFAEHDDMIENPKKYITE